MSEEEPKNHEVPLVEEVPEEERAASKSASAESLRILEALIFASDEFLTAARLKAILPGNPGARQISSMVEKINRQLQKERHPFEIVEVGGGYQFKTVAYYHPWVRQIFQEKAAKRLSIQALECLSIIAYQQPLSKTEIEAIRGVMSDGAMKTLLEKRLITITGRSEKPGRPLLYSVTPEFLKYFGLNKIEDLPNIEEFEAMVRQRIENTPIEELASEQARMLAQSESPFAEGGAVADMVNSSANEAEDELAWLNEKNETITKSTANGESEAEPPAMSGEGGVAEPVINVSESSGSGSLEEIPTGEESKFIEEDKVSDEDGDDGVEVE